MTDSTRQAYISIMPTAMKLHHWILVAMLLGALLGLPLNLLVERGIVDPVWARTAADLGHGAGSLFLRLLQMVVVPLIATSLVTGITSMRRLGDLGRLGGRTLLFYLTSSSLAITAGLTAVNLIRPGFRADLGDLERHAVGLQDARTLAEAPESLGKVLWQQLLHMIPTNPLQAAAEGDMLPVIFFSVLLGIAINAVGGETRELLQRAFRAGFDVMMRITLWVIRLAPIGVLGFMLFAAAGQGLSVFASLGLYMLTVFAALSVHACVTLPMLLWWLGRRSPWHLARALSPALMTAFSTASSNATLPLTMSHIEEHAGVDARVSGFVLPLGATINMDGTALYEAVAVLFIAQAMGMELSLAQQLLVASTALLVSIGAAGIPHAGTVMMVVVLNAVGLPATAVGLLLAVDRVLDMCRTAVNVWSDSVAAAVVDRYYAEAPQVATAVEGSVDE